MNKLNIAIDGYAGCGKSTLAKDLSKALGYTFVDTGALYRGITFLLMQEHVMLDDRSVSEFLNTHQPELGFADGNNHLLLNGTDVETSIRSDASIADQVSQVAAFRSVRAYLLEIQQAFVEARGIVMEGRDIGTVVMPQADIKLFITASVDERVHRRFSQLQQTAQPLSREEVKANLLARDEKDAGRTTAPLRKADDAIALDTSQFDRSQQLEVCLAMIRPYLNPEEFLRFIR